jgi:hypothetical protein
MSHAIGWIAAGLLVVIVTVAVVVLVFFPPHSDPSDATIREGIMDFHTVNIAPSTIAGIDPSSDANAAEDYQQALSFYESNKKDLDNALEEMGKKADYAPDSSVVDKLTKIDSMVASGNQKKRFEYSLVYTPKKFDVTFFYPPSNKFQDLAGGLRMLALVYQRQKKYPQAESVLQHEFLLGWHMMNERARVEFTQRGMGIQRDALKGLKELYQLWQPADGIGKQARVAAFRDSLEGLDRWNNMKYQVIWNVKPYAGDVFNIVERDEDRAWKVEALLGLGVVRYTTDKRGDEKYAMRLLEKYAASSDPVLSAAAVAARDLTVDEFNQVGTKNNPQYGE